MLTRLECIVGSAGQMRPAIVQALHHTRQHKAFGRLLIAQPLMRNVLADLALESEDLPDLVGPTDIADAVGMSGQI